MSDAISYIHEFSESEELHFSLLEQKNKLILAESVGYVIKAAVEASPPARQTLGRGESRQDSPKKVAGAHQSK